MLAAEILMPTRSFRPNCVEDLSVDNIFELSKLYRTSRSATAIRCAEMMGISVFEADANAILWGYGAVRKGSLGKVYPLFAEAIRTVLIGTKDATLVNYTSRVWSGIWKLEGRRTGTGRCLFLFRPHHPYQSVNTPGKRSERRVHEEPI